MNIKPRHSMLQHNLLLNLTQITQQGKITEEKIEQKHSTSTFLNHTLNGLNNQFIRRTYTDKYSVQGNKFHSNIKQGAHQRRGKSQYQSPFQNTFALQPWNDESQLFSTEFKAPLTQIRQKKHKSTNKKSFHITQVPNKIYRKNDCTSNFQQMRKSSYTSKDLNRTGNDSRGNNFSFNTQFDAKEEMKQKTYNYSSEQKVKISLDYIVQKKKHSKMSNLLKMKTHSFDKTLIKQQKASHQSKNLIEALERLPSDKNLRKSIDRAVDVLKKRNHHSLQSNKSIKSKKKLSGAKEIINETSKNWLSCRKIDLQKDDIDGKNLLHNFSASNKDFTLTQKLGIRPQNQIALKQKCKISFKPKRNYLMSRKESKVSSKQKFNKIIGLKSKSRESTKKKFSLGVLLQVNHLNL